jgi:hypothetical protein
MVHLPIGMLFLLLILEWLSRRDSRKNLRASLKIIALLTFVSALVSSVAGYLLAQDSGYSEETLEQHMWMGFGFTIATGILFFFLESKYWNPGRQNLISVLLLFLVGFTGHLGGSLTHGEGYLEEPFLAIFESAPPHRPVRKPAKNPEEALVYSDLVEPVLEKKCFQCHNYRKQKGGLRLDLPEKLRKGGKSGVVLIEGNPEESELYKRLVLPEGDEHRMPPKGKKSLTPTETELIRWWIAAGASMDKKLVQIPDHQKILPLLRSEDESNLSASSEARGQNEFSNLAPPPVSPSILESIKKTGIRVDLLSPKGNLLSVNSINRPDLENLRDLLPVKSQLVWLRLTGSKIEGKGFQDLKEFDNLTRLFLDRTQFGDVDIDNLNNLSNLQILNLVGTQITDEGIRKIASLRSLRKVYLWQTRVRPETIDQLRNKMPETEFNLGEELSTETNPGPAKKI